MFEKRAALGWLRRLRTASPEKGISARFDRYNVLHLCRVPDKLGFDTYLLSNRATNQRICIRRHFFDRFRAIARGVARDLARRGGAPDDGLRFDLFFRTRTIFSFTSDKVRPDTLLIREANPAATSTGQFWVAYAALDALVDLLYHPSLRHPNDLLERIITYHKLFQFSFEEGSSSITSDLLLRKDVLCRIDRYVPGLGKRAGDAPHTHRKDPPADAAQPPPVQPTSKNIVQPTGGLFKSRLAEKESPQYQIDYEKLFLDPTRTNVKAPVVQGRKDVKEKVEIGHDWANLPMLAQEVKAFRSLPFRCELSVSEMKDLRGKFLSDRDSDFYLGFEVIDCVFKKSQKLHTFRFPLYYLRVTLEESPRHVVLTPEDNAVFLNHLALVNAFSSFAKKAGGRSVLDDFLGSLLNQAFEIEHERERVRVLRRLPLRDDVFDQVRQLLIGAPGESGKGGLLGDLETTGIECDLETVVLLKAKRPVSPTVWALERDLDDILRRAKDDAQRFYRSLLGSFLTPEAADNGANGGAAGAARSAFGAEAWMPGALPKSTRKLIDGLNHHRLVLLEGPPGTGKTFTIANLVIHCVATGKRVLVVSDQKSAIQALNERLMDYLLGKARQSAEAKRLEALWQSAVKIIDEIPDGTSSLESWVNQVRQMLRVDSPKDVSWAAPTDVDYVRLAEVDARRADLLKRLRVLIDGRMAKDRCSASEQVAGRAQYPQDKESLGKIEALVRDLRTGGPSVRRTVRDWACERDVTARLGELYDYFDLPKERIEVHIAALDVAERWIGDVIKLRPRCAAQVPPAPRVDAGELFRGWVEGLVERRISTYRNAVGRLWTYLRCTLRYPIRDDLRALRAFVRLHRCLLRHAASFSADGWLQLREVHRALETSGVRPVPLCVEVCRSLPDEERTASSGVTVQGLLEQLARLQDHRDVIVRERFLACLGEIAQNASASRVGGGTNRLTSILATLDSLKGFSSLSSGWPVLKDLQSVLLETFPVWLCRKRAVPFLFPCEEQIFDVVIVDEATQCRVDDALPLLHRANRLMAVGDEKQTVLAKDSVLDDYLFRDFDLDEHLRTAQAGGIKGGGSHLFGLVKRIKQASVMLDEHYRCPPEIIAYSNRYVYDDELKTMQWRMKGVAPTVIVDHSEAKAPESRRKESGKYRGVETDMVDRFLDFVAQEIRRIERKGKRRINVETDVALCYFLLKNEVYMNDVKGKFLTSLKRGRDVLDGAGAALQGKERDYIFYLWDVTRSNIAVFRQADDPSKRKGELNVLMSRPKKCAYHYLHRHFADLPHHSCGITDYLWRAHQDGHDGTDVAMEVGNSIRTGELAATVIRVALGDDLAGVDVESWTDQTQVSVVVGDANRVVDLMLLPSNAGVSDGACMGLVTMSNFEHCDDRAQEVADYFFQLTRASPPIQPLFVFLHELCFQHSQALQRVSAYVRNRGG